MACVYIYCNKKVHLCGVKQERRHLDGFDRFFSSDSGTEEAPETLVT